MLCACSTIFEAAFCKHFGMFWSTSESLFSSGSGSPLAYLSHAGRLEADTNSPNALYLVALPSHRPSSNNGTVTCWCALAKRPAMRTS